MISEELRTYVERNVFPEYEKNDSGHGQRHIDYVIRRSFTFAEKLKNLNPEIIYVVAAFHDIGHSIDPKNHEKVSAEILEKDGFINKYFTKEDILLIKEAIEDHRASKKEDPRSIYGKIVSSADRMTSIDEVIRKTFSYRIKIVPETDLNTIINDSREHARNKFGKQGYAAEKIYFKDEEYENFRIEMEEITSNPEEFKKRYFNVNKIEDSEEYVQRVFKELNKNKELSLDQLFFYTYNKLVTDKSFEEVKAFLKQNNSIDEMEYYLKDVDVDLKEYIETNAFPKYEKNDKGHGMVHISEVIRRAFALNETEKLNLDPNIIYAIAAYHDIGKHINSDLHEKFSAIEFGKDEFMKKFFSKEDRKTIKEAIEDHRSSKEDEPRSEYGKLISSADRNTNIEIVFLRSFFVGQEKSPDSNVEDYLEFTHKRLQKRYAEEDPEKMFYEDDIYKVFLSDMRKLLADEDKFKEQYCQVNGLNNRNIKMNEVDLYKKKESKNKQEDKSKDEIEI